MCTSTLEHQHHHSHCQHDHHHDHSSTDANGAPLSYADPAQQPRELERTIEAGDHFIGLVRAGQHLRITDLHGNQAADTLFYAADDTAERYSAMDTVREQGKVYLTTGTVLYSTRGRPLLTITGDTCGRHDTLGGACSSESNTVRYDLEKRHMHSCRDNWMLAIARYPKYDLTKRDIGHNINFFMNVPVTADGGLSFEDGLSAPGKYVEMVAERDVYVLLSNCPQLNNPCNGYDPTPVAIRISDSPLG